MVRRKFFRAVTKLIAAALAAAAIGGCATRSDPPSPTYVFVHGAFQDSRAWNSVLPLLRSQGIRAEAVNLPGREGDGMALEAVTLDSYRDAVLKLVNTLPGPVVLVGHSFGGITISNVAEAAPEKIKTLVYVAAYLPEAGAPDQSMAKMAEKDEWNQFNKARQNFLLAKDYKSASVLAADQLLLFCADCAPAAQQATLAIMQREPLAPAATPVQLTAARYGAVDKVYIHTTRDNAVSYRLQQMMVARTPLRKSVSLSSGHSPHIESPQVFVDALLALSR
ncbi:MAG: alpha/beta fold hydrolase [Burkholderiales bacterium]|nr:alpha/beta fold hydrolase [Burkholderiales bacterium]